jgi:hypothetical protein
MSVYDKIEATNVKLGAQNCHFEDSGAYTGIYICIHVYIYYIIISIFGTYAWSTWKIWCRFLTPSFVIYITNHHHHHHHRCRKYVHA